MGMLYEAIKSCPLSSLNYVNYFMNEELPYVVL